MKEAIKLLQMEQHSLWNTIRVLKNQSSFKNGRMSVEGIEYIKELEDKRDSYCKAIVTLKKIK